MGMDQILAQSEQSEQQENRVINDVVLMVGFCIIAPLLDVFAKVASTQIPIAQITTFRFVVQALLMVPIFCLM